ncbi:MAG: glycerol-3-phosphate 1-O-acyltransferase PlsY [Nitrospirota bacterium]
MIYIKLALLMLSYLLGSIPFGLVFTRYYAGIDIRTKGSGNIGFTNVLRVVGKKAAFLTLAGDALKGFLPVVAAKLFFDDNNLAAAAGITAVIGHDFPVFLRFKGGKGVATSFGALFGLMPYAGFFTLVIWLTVFYLWKYSSLAAITSYLMLPFIIVFVDFTSTNIAFALCITTLLLIKHIQNIKRLLNGTESKIGSNKRVDINAA